MRTLALSLLISTGCSDKDPITDTTVDTAEDSGTVDSDDTRPEEVESFTLTFTGGLEQAVTFDLPTCTHTAATHFRSLWRDSTGTHTFVLVAEILGGLNGAGSYDQTTAGARIKLQEEAGGGGSFFQTDAGSGDTLNITLEHLDAEAGEAWGEYEFSNLHGDLGDTSATPQPIPIRCPSL